MRKIEEDLMYSFEIFSKYKQKVGSGKAFLYFVLPIFLFYGAIVSVCIGFIAITGGC